MDEGNTVALADRAGQEISWCWQMEDNPCHTNQLDLDLRYCGNGTTSFVAFHNPRLM